MLGNGENKKWTLTKISKMIGIVGTIITIGGGFFILYNGLFNARVEIIQSIAKNRSIIIDDLEIRRDQKMRELELLESKLKIMKPNTMKYTDTRDDIFILKDSIDDLNRLVAKAKKP